MLHKIGVEKLELKVMMKVFKVGTVSHIRTFVTLGVDLILQNMTFRTTYFHKLYPFSLFQLLFMFFNS